MEHFSLEYNAIGANESRKLFDILYHFSRRNERNNLISTDPAGGNTVGVSTPLASVRNRLSMCEMDWMESLRNKPEHWSLSTPFPLNRSVKYVTSRIIYRMYMVAKY